MAFLRFAWRLARRRWARRVLLWLTVRLTRWVGWRRAVRLLLLWLTVRLIRLFGWRPAMRLLFRGASHWRLLVVAVWRATVLMLRASRSALTLAGRARHTGQRHSTAEQLTLCVRQSVRNLGSYRRQIGDPPGKLCKSFGRPCPHEWHDDVTKSVVRSWRLSESTLTGGRQAGEQPALQARWIGSLGRS